MSVKQIIDDLEETLTKWRVCSDCEYKEKCEKAPINVADIWSCRWYRRE